MTETQAVPRRRPPTLGEHTDQVLAELGYSAQDIVGFRERSVI
jgi:crotonobetainyl-CoA:carnitine CoA-transferase CaiB-like acyl-CoA transferase